MGKIKKAFSLALGALMMLGAATGIKPMLEKAKAAGEITDNITNWNSFFGTSYSGTISNVTKNLAILSGTTANGITMNINTGASTNGYLKDADFRMYNGYTMTLGAPNGYFISKVNATKSSGKTISGLTASAVSLLIASDGSSMEWTGNATNLVFTSSATMAFGSMSITISSTSGGSDSSSSSLASPVTGVSLNKETATYEEGDTFSLTATIEPSNAANKNVTWSSNNEGVATVDQTGGITCVAPGVATITVTTEDGNKTASCVLTVTVGPNYVWNIGDYMTENSISGGTTIQAPINLNGVVSLTSATKGTADAKFFNEDEVRVYKTGGSLTFALANGYKFDKVAMTNNGVFTVTTGTISSGVWTASNDSTTSITFTCTSNAVLKEFKFYYSAKSSTEHSISYVLDGGNNNESNPSSYEESDGVASFAEPAKEGFVFGGWYTDNAFNNVITSIPAGSNSDYTLYAKWIEKASHKFGALKTSASLIVNYSEEFIEGIAGSNTEYKYSASDFAGLGKSGGASDGSASIVYTKSGDPITFNSTNGYGNASSNCLQLYSGSDLTISSASGKIIKVEITCTASGTSNYGPSKIELKNGANGNYTYSDAIGTWTGESENVILHMNAQAKATAFVVTISTGTPDQYSYDFKNVGIRFGVDPTLFTAVLKGELDAEAGEYDIYYGVAVCKGEVFDETTAKTSTTQYNAVSVDTGYTFSLVLNGINDFAQKMIAKAFVSINGIKYYAQASIAYSVNSLASEYLGKHMNLDEVKENEKMLTALTSAVYGETKTIQWVED